MQLGGGGDAESTNHHIFNREERVRGRLSPLLPIQAGRCVTFWLAMGAMCLATSFVKSGHLLLWALMKSKI